MDLIRDEQDKEQLDHSGSPLADMNAAGGWDWSEFFLLAESLGARYAVHPDVEMI